MTNFKEKMEKSFILPRTTLKFTGLLPDDNGNLNRFRVIMFIILSTIMLEIVVNELICEWPNYTEVLLIITMFLGHFHCLIKFREYLLSHRKISVLLNTIRTEFWSEVEHSTEDEKQVIEDYGQQAFRFNIFQAGIFSFIGPFAVMKQVIWLLGAFLELINIIDHAPERMLMYKNYYGPHINTYENPYYGILFSIQVFGLLYYLNIFVAIDTLFVYIVFSTVGQMKLIQIRIAKNDMKEREKNLHKYIIHHQRICRFCSELESCYNRSLFIQNALCTLYLCITMYVTLVFMEENPIIVLYEVFGMCAVSIQLFSYFYVADLLTTEGLGIAQAAYNSNWIEASKSTKKSINIIIMRAQKPIYLTVGGFMPASLNSFETVMRTAFSYFTVIKTMMNDDKELK